MRVEVVQQYAQKCAELFAVGGFASVRRTAQAGLDEAGPSPVLYQWLGQAHAAEDEDDHDAEAERAYREGLAHAPDDLGLHVSYLELCLRADAFEYPGRAKRAVMLRARIDELAPVGSPHRERVDTALAWAGRGYWDEVASAATRNEMRQAETAELSERVTEAFRPDSAVATAPDAGGEDLKAAELAAALELLQGPANAPLRLLLAHRGTAYLAAFLGAFAVNRLLVETGVVTFSLWGFLLWIPLLAADAKLGAARKLARQRVVARIEEGHARQTTATGSG
ncbi:hypothetical protein ACFV0T_15540 [Streptomyces sp. NPDC059582]|uniref:hypothetical protein n=1 Tax=Streptomyces sp. NPDC059582 TaxID=3346875 RepID=UPI003696361D